MSTQLEFSRITLNSMRELRPLLMRTRFIDLGFSALYYTADAFDMCYARLGDSAVLRINDGGEYAYVASAQLVPALLCSLKNPRFEYILSEEVDAYKKLGAHISCDPRYSDYFCTYDHYTAVQKSAAPGKYKDYNQFLKKHDVTLEELSTKNLPLARDLLESWCRDRDCSLCAYGCEKLWIFRLFDAWEALPVKGCLMKIDGNYRAFNVAEQNGDTLLKLIAKSVGTPNGAMVYLGVQSAALFPRAKYVNLGADSGVAGLAAFKSKFKPYEKLDKFRAKF